MVGIITLYHHRSKAAQAKKTDTTVLDAKVDLEGGEGGWQSDFEDWEQKPAVPDKKIALQNLEDFDGMAPPPQPKVDNEPDFFSDLGLQPTYVKPEVFAAAPKKKTLQMDVTLDEDIDIDGWEAGNTKKPKKKLGAQRMS